VVPQAAHLVGFVRLRALDRNDRLVIGRRLAVDQPLGVKRGVVAAGIIADRMQRISHVGLVDQERHLAEGLAAKIEVQA